MRWKRKHSQSVGKKEASKATSKYSTQDKNFNHFPSLDQASIDVVM